MFDIEKVIIKKIKSVDFLEHTSGGAATMLKRPNYGISFCVDGLIEFEYDGKKVDLTPNSAILLPQNGKYSWKCLKTGKYPQINFEADDLGTTDLIKFDLGSYSFFESKLKDLQNALITSSIARAKGIFYDIIDNIGGKSRCANGILTKSINYMHENYSDPSLSNQVLAEKSDISEIYFRMLFKEAFGKTPKQYIIDLRIKKACKLLSENYASVCIIAEECGFSSVYHFCRSFKEILGMTPTEYAKNHSFLKENTI